MGLVALTLGCLAVGAYIGRDLSRGLGILFFVGGFTCIFRLSAASEDASSFRPRVACSGWRSVPS